MADKKKGRKDIFLSKNLKDDFKSNAKDITALEAETALMCINWPGNKENKYKVEIAAKIAEIFLFWIEIFVFVDKISSTNIKHA